jgi:hypothetical protein
MLFRAQNPGEPRGRLQAGLLLSQGVVAQEQQLNSPNPLSLPNGLSCCQIRLQRPRPKPGKSKKNRRCAPRSSLPSHIAGCPQARPKARAPSLLSFLSPRGWSGSRMAKPDAISGRDNSFLCLWRPLQAAKAANQPLAGQRCPHPAWAAASTSERRDSPNRSSWA